MNILAIDTSTSICQVALSKNGKIFESAITQSNQAQIILSEIDSILLKAKVKSNQLQAFAFGCGPGSFTGVRIAASVAQGFSFGLDIPVIKISSLQILAQSAYLANGCSEVVTAIDARMNEVYSGYFRLNDQNEMTAQIKESVGPPQKVFCPDNKCWLAVGNAWTIYSQSMPGCPNGCFPGLRVSGQSLIKLAETKFTQIDFASLDQVLPSYLRERVALTEKERFAK